ncbi:hypothetical protein CC86DRAFT_293186 [Ophiobolus disseminans]|uniref:Uncharacterized protein n=1 Tax=Ophiobolus disseminans TaxID=1469910 RepID=A0A6A7A0A1_9PLEO|nr:hypothetical protein CC86DRAFT_293186 [Ophiobolus disseminans]
MATKKGDSRFLRLPQELRDQIYVIVFTSTRLSYGERFDLLSRKVSGVYRCKHHIIPAQHSLALRGVCQQIHAETRNMWMNYVLFNFHDARSMLNKLSSLSQLIPKIRHLRLNNDVHVQRLNGFRTPTYRNDSVFRILAGLHLDSLTIYSDLGYEAHDYNSIWMLIKRSTGWRELFYIVPTSNLLVFMINGSYSRSGLYDDISHSNLPRRPMKNRLSEDDTEPRARIQMYRAHQQRPIASVLDPQKRDLCNEQATSRDLHGFDDLGYTSSIASNTPLLVHAKRERGVDITQPQLDAVKATDMQKRFESRKWKIRRDNLWDDWGYTSDEHEQIWYEVEELASIPPVRDRYEDVDDIW